jgi:hypothetical protein
MQSLLRLQPFAYIHNLVNVGKTDGDSLDSRLKKFVGDSVGSKLGEKVSADISILG